MTVLFLIFSFGCIVGETEIYRVSAPFAGRDPGGGYFPLLSNTSVIH